MAQSRPRNPYELVGLIKGLNGSELKKTALHLRQQILINILLSYINSSEVTAEAFAAGFDSLSNELRTTIGQPIQTQ